MSGWLKLSISLLLSAAIAFSAGAEPIPYSKNNFSFTGDITLPDQIVAYTKAAPKKRKKEADRLYEIAQRDYRRPKSTSGASWGGVGKASLESVLAYPTGRALFLGAEAQLRQWDEIRKRDPEIEKKNPGWTRDEVANAMGWLNSAIAVDAYEPSLDEAQRAKLISYCDCMKHYLDTGKAEPTCVPLQWAGVVGSK